MRELGLFNLLEVGDSIMVDKGFDIDDLFKLLGVIFNMLLKRDFNC